MRKEIIKLLVEKGADVNALAENSRLPLFNILSDDCGRHLIKGNEDKFWRLEEGLGCLDERLEIAEYLVEKGADTSPIIDGNGNRLRTLDKDSREFLYSHGVESIEDEIATDRDLMEAYIVTYTERALKYIFAILLLIFIIKKVMSALRAKKRASLLEKVTKVKERANGTYDSVSIINCEYLPEQSAKREELIAQVVDVKNRLNGLDGKEDTFEEKSFNKELENLDKVIGKLKQEVDSLHNAVQSAVETISQMRGILHDAENSFESLKSETSEYLDFSAVKPLHRNVSTLLEEINNLNRVIEATNDYKAMRAFIDRYENDISNLRSKVDSLRYEWESTKQDLKEYKSLLDRMKKIYNSSEKNYEYCRSISGNEDAKRLEPLFDTIRMSAKPLIDAIMNQQKINREEITTLETQFNEYNREFETQLKAVVEFKQLPNDRAKKEWILKNGYLSWFFDDTTIAEKFREFDDMEEKFKYLIKASEKLRFLDLEKERKDEGKTTWLVFMNEIKSDMSYDKLKEFMRAWQTDAKFKGISDQWKKKLNESNIEDKKLLTITTKFIGMKF